MEKYKVISLGAGVQSSTLLMLAAHKEIETPDHIVFSDTGWEPKSVYDYLAFLQEELKKFPHMPPITITQKGSIRDDLLRAATEGKRVATIPFFTKAKDGSPGIVIRQCTSEYKIEPVKRKIRELIGWTGKRNTDKDGNLKLQVEMYLGISTDEEQRMKVNPEPWVKNMYPLIELEMSRYDCLEWMHEHGYPLPPKSSCIGCPFHDNKMWADMQINDPESFADAVYVDNAIRKMPKIDGEVYLHRSLKPLGEIEFHQQLELFDGVDMFRFDCAGMCGV